MRTVMDDGHTQRDDERHWVLQNAFHVSKEDGETWYIKPPRGYWSQHLRAAACPCGNTRLGSSSRDPVDIL